MKALLSGGRRVHDSRLGSCGGRLLLCAVMSAICVRAVKTFRYSLARPTYMAFDRETITLGH